MIAELHRKKLVQDHTPFGTVEAVVDLPNMGEGESKDVVVQGHRLVVTKHGDQFTVSEP
jgi:hypothetical protein